MKLDLLHKAHKGIGLATVVIFLATGIYMRLNFPDLYHSNGAVRFIYRANHIYILMAGLINLGLGMYLEVSARKWRRRFQITGSTLLLIGPVLLIAAFWLEPQHASPERPFTAFGVFSVALGILAHLIANVRLSKP